MQPKNIDTLGGINADLSKLDQIDLDDLSKKIQEKANEVIERVEKSEVNKRFHNNQPLNLAKENQKKLAIFAGLLGAGISLLTLGKSLLANEKLSMLLDLGSTIAGSLGNEKAVDLISKLTQARNIALSSQQVSLSEVLEKAARTDVKSPLEALQLTGLSTVTWLGAKLGVPKLLQLVSVLKPEYYDTIVRFLKAVFGKHRYLLEAWGISAEQLKQTWWTKFKETKYGKVIAEYLEKFKALVDKFAPVIKWLAKVLKPLGKLFSFVFSKIKSFFSTLTDAIRAFKERLFEYNPLKLLQLVNPVAFAPFLEPLYAWTYEKFKGLVKSSMLSSLKLAKWVIKPVLERQQKQQKSIIEKAQGGLANFLKWAIRFLQPGWKGAFWRRVIRLTAWLGTTRFGQYFLIPLLKALNIPGLSMVFTILEKYPLLTKIASYIAKFLDKILVPIRKMLRGIYYLLLKILRKLGMRSELKTLNDIFYTVDYTLDKVIKTFISASERIDKIQSMASKVSKSLKATEMLFKVLFIGGKVLLRASPFIGLAYAGYKSFAFLRQLFAPHQKELQKQISEQSKAIVESKTTHEKTIEERWWVSWYTEITKKLESTISKVFDISGVIVQALQSAWKTFTSEKHQVTISQEQLKKATSHWYDPIVNFIKNIVSLLGHAFELVFKAIRKLAGWISTLFGTGEVTIQQKNKTGGARLPETKPVKFKLDISQAFKGTTAKTLLPGGELSYFRQSIQAQLSNAKVSETTTKTLANITKAINENATNVTTRALQAGRVVHHRVTKVSTKSSTSTTTVEQRTTQKEPKHSSQVSHLTVPSSVPTVSIARTTKEKTATEILIESFLQSSSHMLKSSDVYWLDDSIWLSQA